MSRRSIVGKDTCNAILKNKQRSVKLRYFVLLPIIIAAFAILSVFDLHLIVAFAVAALIIDIIVGINSVKRFSQSNIYFEKDTVEKVKMGYASRGKNFSCNKVYSFEFSNNGKYHISKSNQPIVIEIKDQSFGEIDRTHIEKSALARFEAGETFYILISEYKNQKTILQIFSTDLFDISPDDFEVKEDRYILIK